MSNDALDHRLVKRTRFSRSEKREYAKRMRAEELIMPPKDPPPAWMSDPSLLPKKPPGRT